MSCVVVQAPGTDTAVAFPGTPQEITTEYVRPTTSKPAIQDTGIISVSTCTYIMQISIMIYHYV